MRRLTRSTTVKDENEKFCENKVSPKFIKKLKIENSSSNKKNSNSNQKNSNQAVEQNCEGEDEEGKNIHTDSTGINLIISNAVEGADSSDKSANYPNLNKQFDSKNNNIKEDEEPKDKNHNVQADTDLLVNRKSVVLDLDNHDTMSACSLGTISSKPASVEIFLCGEDGEEVKINFVNVYKVLKSAELQRYYTNFINNYFHDRSLKTLNDDDLQVIFGKNRGDMSIFRYHLKKFLISGECLSDSDNNNCDELNKTENDLELENVELNFYKDKKDDIIIESILKRDKQYGRNILRNSKKVKLDDTTRKQLVHIVVKYLLNKKIWLERPEFDDLFEKIKFLLPEESKKDYLSDRTGYLYDYYHNQVKQYRKKGAFPRKNNKKSVESKVSNVKTEQEQDQVDENVLSEINWLRLSANTQNWTLFESKWNKTAKIRCRDYFKMEFAELKSKWPMIANVEFAAELISLDFQFLFPDKSLIYEKRFDQFIEFISKNKPKDFKLPSQDNKDSYEISVFKALHFLLIPTRFSEEKSAIEEEYVGCSKPRWIASKKEKISFKFSRLDSFKSTIMTLKFGEVLEDEIQGFAREKKKLELHFHPLMVVVNDKHGDPNGFYLYLNQLIMKAADFKSLLLLYMQSFHVFDFHYPSEGRMVCDLMSCCLLDYSVTTAAGSKAIKALGDKFFESIKV